MVQNFDFAGKSNDRKDIWTSDSMTELLTSAMVKYRKFRNMDPPALVDIWRSRASIHGVCDHVGYAMLEQMALAKPYFDPEGLIVACNDEDRPIGFAHAGFGPNERRDDISTESGATAIVMVHPKYDVQAISKELLGRCESYLTSRGATQIYGGSVRPIDPFYRGMYGGSEMPGVLTSDIDALDLYRNSGYEEEQHTILMRRHLEDFVGPVDRTQMFIRRQMVVEVIADPKLTSWWEACTLGDYDLTLVQLRPRRGGDPVARAIFRSMQPIGIPIDTPGAGMIHLQVDANTRKKGIATFLLSEAFRHFVRNDIMVVSAQFFEHHEAAMNLCRKLGFQMISRGVVFKKK